MISPAKSNILHFQITLQPLTKNALEHPWEAGLSMLLLLSRLLVFWQDSSLWGDDLSSLILLPNAFNTICVPKYGRLYKPLTRLPFDIL